MAAGASQLRQPPWGRYTGLVVALRAAYLDALDGAAPAALEALRAPSAMTRLFALRDEKVDGDLSARSRLPGAKKVRTVADLFDLAVTLRNRVTHAWSVGAGEVEALRGVVDWFAARRPLDFVRAEEGWTAPVLADLCTGSGTIAFALANEVPGATVHAVERDPDALAWTHRNAANRDAQARHGAQRVDRLRGAARQHHLGGRQHAAEHAVKHAQHRLQHVDRHRQRQHA